MMAEVERLYREAWAGLGADRKREILEALEAMDARGVVRTMDEPLIVEAYMASVCRACVANGCRGAGHCGCECHRDPRREPDQHAWGGPPIPASVGPENPHVACRVPTVREVLQREAHRHREAGDQLLRFMHELPLGVLDAPNEWLTGVLLRGLRGE